MLEDASGINAEEEDVRFGTRCSDYAVYGLIESLSGSDLKEGRVGAREICITRWEHTCGIPRNSRIAVGLE
jgi:hypothetical protein